MLRGKDPLNTLPTIFCSQNQQFLSLKIYTEKYMKTLIVKKVSK